MMLGHYVYFSLHDNSPAAIVSLMTSAEELLAAHEGIVFFAVGSRTPNLDREVNDQKFDVALQIVFSNRLAHDTYQESSQHHRFINDNKSNWGQIRVFDVDIQNRMEDPDGRENDE
jgi:hypothetical protein